MKSFHVVCYAFSQRFQAVVQSCKIFCVPMLGETFCDINSKHAHRSGHLFSSPNVYILSWRDFPGLTAMLKQDDHVMTWYDHGDSYSPWSDPGKVMSW